MSDPIDRLNEALEGRYAIERELGAGGMATVYLAEDLRHHRKVAVKVLKPDLAAVVGAERFLAEIEVTARLQHPNILPLFDSGEANGFLFYVMPYVEGESLRERLDRDKQLPVDEAVRIAAEVSEALQSAHEQGVVHRDIKPANILLSQGRPLVADFGIALAVSSAGGQRLTETGLSVGTPHYMSPEQATGDRVVGPPSDIYSLGCVLYEMLAGEPPYTGSTAQAILGRIITSEPTPVTDQRRTVPLHVDAVVRRALEKVPADRFASAAGFAEALRDEAFRHDASAQPERARTHRKTALAITGWVAAAVLGLVLFTMRPSPESTPVRRLSLSVPEGFGPSEVTLVPDGSAAIVSDRTQTSDPPNARSLYLQRLDDLARTAIAGSTDLIDWAVSPDGRQVVFGTTSGLYVGPLSGGSPRLVANASACCMRWADDGQVYYTFNGAVHRVRPAGGVPEVVLDPGPSENLFHYTPIGDGRRAIFVTDADTVPRIDWIEPASGDRGEIVEGDRPVLLPDGYLVFDLRGGLFAARLDLSTLEVLAGPVRMVERISTTAWDAMFGVSESGDLVYWSPRGEAREGSELVWVDRQGEATVADSAWIEDFESVEISPDGTRVAVTVGSIDRTEVWIKDLDGGAPRRLTSYQGMNRRPVWAPDGASVAFISDRGGRRAVYRVPVDGIVSPELLLEHPEEDIDEAVYSPDGDWLIYRTGTTDGGRDIYARRLGPDTTTIAVSARPGIDERAPALSPNGRWLAYVSSETGEDAVWVRPFPDVGAGSRRVSSGSAIEPLWSAAGDELFSRAQDGMTSIRITDPTSFATGEVRTLFPNVEYMYFPAYRAYGYSEGRERFLMIRSTVRAATPPALIFVQNFLAEVEATLGG